MQLKVIEDQAHTIRGLSTKPTFLVCKFSLIGRVVGEQEQEAVAPSVPPPLTGAAGSEYMP